MPQTLPATVLDSSPVPVPQLAAAPAQPTAIGPDGFSEYELRAMMLRLHRSGPPEHGETQSLLGRRSVPPEIRDGRGQARTAVEADPTAVRPEADRFAPGRGAADRLRAQDYSAENGAIAC